MTDKSHTQESSEELENKVNEQSSEQKAVNSESESSEETPRSEEANDSDEKNPLTELQEKYASLNDKYLRLYSEFENYRRRTSKEKLETIKSANANVVKDLLPIVDDFDRAISSNENIDDPESLKEGFKLIHQKLFRILEQQGLKPMDSIGNTFDTEYHEAITNIPAPSDEMKGKVVDVAEKGYFFHDAVLRYAKVVVGQ